MFPATNWRVLFFYIESADAVGLDLGGSSEEWIQFYHFPCLSSYSNTT